jgi:hypothetical protein
MLGSSPDLVGSGISEPKEDYMELEKVFASIAHLCSPMKQGHSE